MAKDFHERPYDEGTLSKLRIFELYTQEWLPVFLSQPTPRFKEVHLFDFFSGPGTDAIGVHGSPLRIFGQLRGYHNKGMAGWNNVRIVVHLFDEDERKIKQLAALLASDEWIIPGIQVDCRPLAFHEALTEHQSLLSDKGIAKLLIIDQYGVDEVSDQIFRQLIAFPVTDFIFFLSSSTLYRFRDHPAIKQKIERPEDSYDIHRATVDYYRKLIPTTDKVFLGSFSIRKPPNIYGLIFGSRHPLGIHKFLQVAWANDELAGEANFDIERENIRPGEGILPLDVMRPNKLREFERELETALRAGWMHSEADVARFCVEAGMTCKHSARVLKKLKSEGLISSDFQVPDIRRIQDPRPLHLIHQAKAKG
jgi:three-Cys-motif partner protein